MIPPEILNILMLIGGIVVLVFSGDYLVKGGVNLARHFNISTLVIGLTVVAFGTSAPELFVSAGAALSGNQDIALGNIIGSNIANIALVLGLTVCILKMPVAESTMKRSWPIMFISGIVLYAFMYNNRIGHFEGAIMFMLLILFLVYSIRSSKKNFVENENNKSKPQKLWVTILVVIGATGGLALGSKFLVQGASGIASSLGVSDRIISLTVVAFGTSLPELTASVIAAFKKETDISVGNIVGSNIFNVFAVIGLTTVIKPLNFNFEAYRIDLYFMLLFYVLLFVLIVSFKTIFKRNNSKRIQLIANFKKMKQGLISRPEGLILVVLYVVYVTFILKTR